MGLHFSFGVGPIRYTTSSRRRYKTKAQREADAAALKGLFWLVALILALAVLAVWSVLIIAASIVWLPVTAISSVRYDGGWTRRHLLLLVLLPLAGLAGLRYSGGWFSRHWTEPFHLAPWYGKAAS
jgi:hypothetical protein